MAARMSESAAASRSADHRPAQEYNVELDVFTGPLDLLLFLIRRDELDIQDISISRVTEQYVAYVRLLEQIDPNVAGEFLVMAATLIELKSRALLPTPPLEAVDAPDDPRAVLVRQLLEYKRFKDAARSLGSAADERARRYVRRPCDLPAELQGVELEEVQVWDLLVAFNRVMSAVGRGPLTHDVTYDDTPIALHAAEIIAVLERDGPTTFCKLFDGRTRRVEVVGLFLAILELIRQRQIRAEQERSFGEIYLFLLQEVDPDAPFADRADASPDGDAARIHVVEEARGAVHAAERGTLQFTTRVLHPGRAAEMMERGRRTMDASGAAPSLADGGDERGVADQTVEPPPMGEAPASEEGDDADGV
ncbi:MAG: Segregation and condensation protein A [Phycisphaerae bacterium]|nr:Segregation and condensation protein A [Phycisphaerae bacterium]